MVEVNKKLINQGPIDGPKKGREYFLENRALFSCEKSIPDPQGEGGAGGGQGGGEIAALKSVKGGIGEEERERYGLPLAPVPATAAAKKGGKRSKRISAGKNESDSQKNEIRAMLFRVVKEKQP